MGERVNANDWLREVSAAEDPFLPTNLGNLTSDKDKMSSQMTRPRLGSSASVPDNVLIINELTSPDIAPAIEPKTNKRRRPKLA